MMRGVLTFFAFVSVIFFPWLFTVFLTLVVSLREPLVPLAIGIFTDTLYYSPSAFPVPLFTFLGTVVTIIAFFVRSRLRTGSMR